MPTVFVITPVKLYRDGIARFLDASTGVTVVGTAEEGATGIPAASAASPDVVLLDMALKDSWPIARALRAALPGVAVVALAVPESEEHVLGCAEAGIDGYVPREGTLEDLLAAMVLAAQGQARCSPAITGGLLRRVAALSARDGRPSQPATASPLTARENEVLRLIDEGLSNKQIARQLCIEVATVKNHVHSILEKLGASSRGEAAASTRRLAAHS